MRWLASVCALVIGVALSGCAIIEAEKDNRGGFLDVAADDLWMKADSKKMRTLRALAIEASLARIAMITPKSAPDRALLARRIGETSKRADVVRQCAFSSQEPKPLILGQRADEPCFFFDSVMVDYENALFDLALVALPIDDAKTLLTRVAGGVGAVSINPLELVQALLDIGREAFRYGRVVGAIYRDTLELEVQVWLASPEVADRVAGLRAAYNAGNDNIPAWRAEIAALRAQGLEPVPDQRFILQIYGILTYICGQIVSKQDDSYAQCAFKPPGHLIQVATGPGGRLFSGGASGGTGSGGDRAGRVRTDLAKKSVVSDVDKRKSAVIDGAITEVEKTISLDSGKAIQRTLCVTADGNFGTTNSPTRQALRLFNSAFTTAGQNGALAAGLDRIQTDNDLIQIRAAVGAFPSCVNAGFKNGFEVGIFVRNGSDTMRRYLAAALAAPPGGVTAPPQLTAPAPGTSTMDPVMRQTIRDLRTKFGLAGPEELDRQLYDRIVASSSR